MKKRQGDVKKVRGKQTHDKTKLTNAEENLLLQIRLETNNFNVDNISRTSAYLDYYLKQPDMIWAFHASMVSRNGGYNMCDLEGEWFPRTLDNSIRQILFLTYEKANWTIFRVSYPLLLLCNYFTKIGRPMFQLLPYLNVSAFMEQEWTYYWKWKDKKRLLIALIVNEQNVINDVVIEHHLFQKKVFNSVMFIFQDYFHYSSVLLPTIRGELYGASVNGFKSVHKRINLGKRIATILFDQELYPEFLEFALKTEHTGSRHDYEQYFSVRKKRDTPYLRWSYPIVSHHYQSQPDWFSEKKFHRSWMNPTIKHRHPILLTDWFLGKQKEFQALISLQDLISKKG